MGTRKTIDSTLLGVTLVVVAGQLAAINFDLFETLYAFSRAHEDWEIDEFFTLVLFSFSGMATILVARTLQLKRALGARDAAEREARVMSRQDPLTGLPNRRALQEHFDAVAAIALHPEAEQAIAFLIDLDRFKHVNDLHGHDFGDGVLKMATDRILSALGTDDFVARLGGDEFAVILGPGSHAACAERKARRLIESLEQPFEHAGVSVLMGASVGISRCAMADLHATALRLADQALYAAKRNGRGQFAWYHAELGNRATERALLETDLRKAIKNGDVVPYFQPIVEIGRGTITGFEVLARWAHPKWGPVSPSVFIEVAEEIGLIGQLGTSVLRQACVAARSWDEDTKIAVNISPKQLRDPMLAITIGAILTETDFAPSRLEIEVTESAIIADFDAARKTIVEIQELGISVSLDDFGTGYSSLSSLQKLPFDRIKIDRSFVTDIASKPENQKILAGVMALAHGLDLSVTAEGVETETDRNYLISVNCISGQGFWFDRPRPAEHAAWLLQTTWSSKSINAARNAPAATPLEPRDVGAAEGALPRS
jgi:diguanylate cyclase (GGDEF)-like protein